jgi:hypothetical protein
MKFVARELAQAMATSRLQFSTCKRCGRRTMPVVVALPSRRPLFDKPIYWCSTEHAAADGWPWLTSERRRQPRHA